MEQYRNSRSKTKIVPPKSKASMSLSRDEARSIDKHKRGRRRKAGRIAFLIALAIAVISIGIVLVLSVFFKINTVTIKGDRVYSDKDVVLKSGIEIGENLFRVNEKDLNASLTKALPYIAAVTVERQLPDTVIINVTATKEVAALPAGAGFVLIDHTGKVLDKDASMLREGVPVVSGASAKSLVEGEIIALGNQALTDKFIELLQGIKKSEINLLTEINITKSNEYNLRYDDRITIKLGTGENVVKKLQRAMAAIEKENQINAYAEGVLDLRTEPYAYFSPGEEETTTSTTAVATTLADGGTGAATTKAPVAATTTEVTEAKKAETTKNNNNNQNFAIDSQR